MHLPHLLIRSLGFLVILESCSQSHGSSYTTETATIEVRPKTAAELRAELLQREQSAPGEYLQVQGTYRRNLIGQLVLEGTITNQATLATFKDPVLAVTWYSKTNTELGTQTYSVYELVRAQGAKRFKLKTNAPGYVASVAMGIGGGTAVE
jgi:hypothetical protein